MGFDSSSRGGWCVGDYWENVSIAPIQWVFMNWWMAIKYDKLGVKCFSARVCMYACDSEAEDSCKKKLIVD